MLPTERQQQKYQHLPVWYRALARNAGPPVANATAVTKENIGLWSGKHMWFAIYRFGPRLIIRRIIVRSSLLKNILVDGFF